MNVLQVSEALAGTRGEAGVEFDAEDFGEIVPGGINHLAVVRAGFDEHVEAMLVRVLLHQFLFRQVRRSGRLAAELPIPKIRIVTETLVRRIEGRATKETAKGFHRKLEVKS